MVLELTYGNVPLEWYGKNSNSPDLKLWGPDVASVAGVITLPYRYQRVTGALAITGINAPDGTTLPGGTWSGKITVFPVAAFTWTAATNIVVAGTAVIGKMLDFLYNPLGAAGVGKWYPSYIA